MKKNTTPTKNGARRNGKAIRKAMARLIREFREHGKRSVENGWGDGSSQRRVILIAQRSAGFRVTGR
jgi:hypothetical protein